MKKMIFIAAMILAPLSANAETVNVKVNGLVCSFCATAIEKTFAKKGVANVDVNLEEKYVKFDVPEGSEMNDEEITETINDAGYDVKGIERSE